MEKTFTGWIDIRDLERIKKKYNRFSFPNRHLIVYDKHWYDGKCVKVEIKLLEKLSEEEEKT